MDRILQHGGTDPRGGPEPRSILVVLPTWVGDFVMATPTLRAIRRRFSRSHITFLIEPNLRDLARGGDWMNECVEWPAIHGAALARGVLAKGFRDLIWDLRRRRFDCAVLLPNSFRSALAVRLAGAKRRIGYDRDGRGILLTDRLSCRNRLNRVAARFDGIDTSNLPSLALTPPVRIGDKLPVALGRYAPIPMVEYYADLAEAIGCDRPGDRLELLTTPDDDATVESRLRSLGLTNRRPLVVISPGARYGAAKCWPPERFAAVADRLIEADDAAVVVTCGPGEEPIARRIASSMARDAVVLDEPRLGLGELKSLIARCDLLVCNDAGPRHIAKAFNVPVVTVFGPTHPAWTATAYPLERIVRVDIECGPCQQRICPLGHLRCMDAVTVESVVMACHEVLAARRESLPRHATAAGGSR